MTYEQIERLRTEFLKHEEEILWNKSNQYSNGLDRLLNFKQIASWIGVSPSDIALIYLMKHIQAIVMAVNRRSFDLSYMWKWQTDDGEGLKQRIADARNYLLLLAACIDDEVSDDGEDVDR